MRAARFYGRHDLRVEDTPEPGAPIGSEVLIATEWCGICGSDLHEYRAGPIQVPRDPHPLTGAGIPQILGHEFAGRVLAAGPDASVSEGDRVAVMPLVTCGRCSSCRRGLAQLCPNRAAIGMSHPWGGLAAYALVDSANAVPLPDTIATDRGALLEPAAVAVTAVRRAEIQPGASVLVAGGGPIGALVALAATAAGAGAVVVLEPSEPRAQAIRRLSAATVLDPSQEGLERAMAGVLGADGSDVAFECVGSEQALRTCVHGVRPGGTVILCGLHTRPAALDVTLCVEKQLSLRGSYCYDTHDWSDVIARVASGELPAERIVTTRVSLDRVVEEGFEPLSQPGTGDIKILVATS